MCSVVGGFDNDTVIKLAQMNEYRGTHSHSICYFDIKKNSIFYLKRGFGALRYEEIDIPKDHFCVVHQQAPTTENKNQDSIHPAQAGEHYLWHNGIVKEKEVKRLQIELESTSTWDTKLILKHLIETGNVDNIDGTFACVLVDYIGMSLFRNEIAPLFYTKSAFSSTKFEGSTPLTPNAIFGLDFTPENEILFYDYKSFKTVENPYYFGE